MMTATRGFVAFAGRGRAVAVAAAAASCVPPRRAASRPTTHAMASSTPAPHARRREGRPIAPSLCLSFDAF